MKNIDLKKVLGLLGVMLKCPVCGHKANLETMNILESEQNDVSGEGRMVIHSDCQKCHGNVMFNIGVYGPELMSSASITDLTSAETHRLLGLEPISANDVLEMHSAVQGFSGDFVTALRNPDFGIKVLPRTLTDKME